MKKSNVGDQKPDRFNIIKLTEYINSQIMPDVFMKELFYLCKPRAEHLANRNEESEIIIR